MEFSGQYLTYEEYKAIGGTLDQTPFNLLEFEARKKIDERTQRRLIGISDIPQEVKICIFKMVELLNNYADKNSKSKNVASESIDGYSISYITAEAVREVIKSKNAELDDIIMTCLLGVVVNKQHLLFLGVH